MQDLAEAPGQRPAVDGVTEVGDLPVGGEAGAGTIRGLVLAGDMRLRTGRLDGCREGEQVTIAVRPEKIWLSDLTPEMVQTDGLVKATVYGGPTTTYLIEIAPGVELAVLEQNLQRARTEDRWSDGERVRIGWLPEHWLVLH